MTPEEREFYNDIILQAFDNAVTEMKNATAEVRENYEETLRKVCGGNTPKENAPIRFYWDGFYYGLAQGLEFSQGGKYGK